MSGKTTGDPEHELLYRNRHLAAGIGLLHTFLSAGIVFGWASLYPVLRHEGVFEYEKDPTLSFSTAFTCGAIGNYLSNLPMGALLDSKGPRTTGVVASILMTVALLLCSNAVESGTSLILGYGLLGFAGPAVQLPTLHLSNLFDKNGSALYMSLQAAAFDGGCLVFTICEFLAKWYDVELKAFFSFYSIVPISVLLTSIMLWPRESIQNQEETETEQEVDVEGKGKGGGQAMASEEGRQKESILEENDQQFRRNNRSMSNVSSITSSPGGPGSPFLGLLMERSVSGESSDDENRLPTIRKRVNEERKTYLHSLDLWSCLKTREFLFLGLFTSTHILKLNFIVSSINDQLLYAFHGEEDIVTSVVAMFGVMLPFGFVILPFTAYLLRRSPVDAMQVANCFAVIYTACLALRPTDFWLQVVVTFPLVAVSRQLVYSTVFFMVGEYFGFKNYGVILGLINIIVSAIGMLQYPLVLLAEKYSGGNYFSADTLLLLILLPLFFADHILKSDVAETKNRTHDKMHKTNVLREYKKMRVQHEIDPLNNGNGNSNSNSNGSGNGNGKSKVKKVVSYQAIN